jgi:hypothetical protein
VRSVNEKTISEELAQRIADLVADLTGQLRSIEDHRDNASRAQQTNLTIICRDDDSNSIEFHTENGFVIVRPWEAKDKKAPAAGAFRFRVQDPDGIERDIGVEISNQLLSETAVRTGGRIETSSQFWICCAERRLANYLMERDEFPTANEIKIDTMDREDVLLAIRWGKTT